MNSGQPLSIKGLSPEQARAVLSPSPRVMVIACAGSGKTSTAVANVLHWLEQGVDPKKILLLTFTRKAGEEMRGRLENRSPVDVSGLFAGTFHSLACQLVRRHPGEFGLDHSPCILDKEEAAGLWKEAAKKAGGDPRRYAEVAQAHSLAASNLVPVVNFFPRHFRLAGQAEIQRHLKASVSYTRLKREYKAVDFDDFLVLWNRALAAGKGGAGEWTHVMVDEFQDNNEAQYSILKGLGAQREFVVGDPNQSIYAFRGSAPALMRRYAEERTGCSVFTLSENYRSGQRILDVANHILLGGESPAELRAVVKREAEARKTIVSDQFEEARFVGRKIRESIAAGTPPKNIAVLARSGYYTQSLEMDLIRTRTSYRKYGGTALADSADAKDYLALLRVCLNPDDRLAKSRIAQMFPGVGRKTAARDTVDRDQWPVKAAPARDWISAALALGWPRAGRFLAEKLVPLLKIKYGAADTRRVQRLSAIAGECEQFCSMQEMVDHYVLNRIEKGKHPEDAVTISTIHSAKGLEWPVVHIIGAGARQIPLQKNGETVDTEEERRLFYVAVTRARESLHITAPRAEGFLAGEVHTPFLSRDSWEHEHGIEEDDVDSPECWRDAQEHDAPSSAWMLAGDDEIPVLDASYFSTKNGPGMAAETRQRGVQLELVALGS